MKAKTNELFDDFTGSTGNITASHSAGHLVVRNKTIPTYRDTDYQRVVRENFAKFSKNWSDLTDQQRDKWNNKAKEVASHRSTFGISGKISGFNLYLQCNMNLQIVNLQPALTSPADDLPAIVPDVESISLGDDALTVGLAENVNKDDIIVIRLTPLKSGQSTNTNGLRQVGLISSGTKETNVLDKYSALFAMPEEKQKIQIQIYAINKNSGFASSRKMSVINVIAADQPAE